MVPDIPEILIHGEESIDVSTVLLESSNFSSTANGEKFKVHR
jgi:hypothetical protein